MKKTISCLLLTGLMILCHATILARDILAQDRDDRHSKAVELNSKGIGFLEEKRYLEAIKTFQAALDLLHDSQRIKRNLAAAYSHLGVQRLKSGRFSDAGRALNQAAGLDPDNPNLRYYRGFLAFKQGRYAESIRLLKSSLAKDPKKVAAWISLGHCHYRLDQLKQTLVAWDRALRLDPGAHGGLMKLRQRVRAEVGFKEISVAGRSRHFRIKADGSRPGFDRIAMEVLGYLEQGYNKVCADLGFYPGEVVTVVLHTRKDFRRVTGTHHWVGGTFDGARIRLPVRDFDKHRASIQRTLVHEFTHMVVHRLAGGAGVPAWINEGIARVEEGITDQDACETLRRLGGASALFPLEKLNRPFSRMKSAVDARRAYAQSCSFTHHLIRSFSTRGVGRFIRFLRDPPDGGGMPAAFKKAFGIELSEAEKQWKTALEM